MADVERTRSLEIGPLRAHFEPPDLVYVRWDGSPTLEAFDALYTQVERWMPDGRRYFVIADTARFETPAARVRKVVARDPRTRRIAGVALLGASFQMRVVMGLFLKALAFFNGEHSFQAMFGADDGEARAWVEAARARA